MTRKRLSSQQWLLGSLWVVVNLVAIGLATMVVLMLYSALRLAQYSDLKEGFDLLKGLAICGAAQGAVLAGFQTIVLLAARLADSRRRLLWFGATIVSMATGMALPAAYGLSAIASTSLNPSLADSLDEYTLGGWVMSWLLAGLVWGAIAGSRPTQRVRWALLNAAAYLCWGLSATFGWLLLISAEDSGTSVVRPHLFILAGLVAVGTGLHQLVFRGLLRRQGQPLT